MAKVGLLVCTTVLLLSFGSRAFAEGSQSAKPFRRVGLGTMLGSKSAGSKSAPSPVLGSQAATLGSRSAAPSAKAPLGSRAATSRVASSAPPTIVKAKSAAKPAETSYRAKITTKNPTAILILADQSGSMSTPWGTTGKSKADAMADAVNNILNDLVDACVKSGEVRDYLQVGVLGAADLQAVPVLEGALAGQNLVKISQVAEHATIVNERPVWLRSTTKSANGDVQAFQKAAQVLHGWTHAHPDSHPPTVINITDGAAVDGDPRPHAGHLRANVGTKDGKTLVYNIHIGDRGHPIVFPDNPSELPNAEARVLFEMSSVLPQAAREAARKAGFRVSDTARGFAYNADLPMLVNFLSVGSSHVGGAH